MNDFTLAGKRAVVTGASRGLGREIGLALAEYGADVVGFARTASELATLAVEIERRGRRFVGVAGSVAERADVAALTARTASRSSNPRSTFRPSTGRRSSR